MNTWFEAAPGIDLSSRLQDLIASIADEAESDVRELLPDLKTGIRLQVRCVGPVIPEVGEAGMSLADGIVVWCVDPRRDVEEIVRARLRSSLFHELHHQVRGWVTQGGDRRASFIEGPISEGLATAFERDFGDSKPLWGDYPGNAEEWARELCALAPDANYAHWMFMHPDGRRWIGYRAGTFIVDQARARSGKTSADLVHASTATILQLAELQ